MPCDITLTCYFFFHFQEECVQIAPGFEVWDPVKLDRAGAFRILGLKHLAGDRYLLALGGPVDFIKKIRGTPQRRDPSNPLFP